MVTVNLAQLRNIDFAFKQNKKHKIFSLHFRLCIFKFLLWPTCSSGSQSRPSLFVSKITSIFFTSAINCAHRKGSRFLKIYHMTHTHISCLILCQLRAVAIDFNGSKRRSSKYIVCIFNIKMLLITIIQLQRV